MCAPIPKGKWSWKYEKCLVCELMKYRHKGRGLCIRCWDKKRGENPKRKEYKRKASKAWQERFFANPENFEKNRLYNEKWRRSSRAYQKWLKKQYLKLSFERFIKHTAGYKLKKWVNGLEIIINGERIKTPIQATSNVNSDNNKMIYEIELFKKVYLKHKSLT